VSRLDGVDSQHEGDVVEAVMRNKMSAKESVQNSGGLL
jgi:hypothetical protein